MLPESKIDAFMKRAIEQSRSGDMRWTIDRSPQEFESDEEFVGYPSKTNLGSNYLRIAQIRYKYWMNEERWVWDSRIVLDFVDSDGKLLWRFPPNTEIPELYEVVRFASSGVADAISEFLEENKKK